MILSASENIKTNSLRSPLLIHVSATHLGGWVRDRASVQRFLQLPIQKREKRNTALMIYLPTFSGTLLHCMIDFSLRSSVWIPAMDHLTSWIPTETDVKPWTPWTSANFVRPAVHLTDCWPPLCLPWQWPCGGDLLTRLRCWELQIKC